jgi:acetamidase/formamidase
MAEAIALPLTGGVMRYRLCMTKSWLPVVCSLRGTIQVGVRKGERLNWPRGETPTHYISMGLHTDLDEAARLAVREMIDFLVKEKGLSRDDAYILCSLAVDLRVTQLVDGVKGIHAMVAKSIFR